MKIWALVFKYKNEMIQSHPEIVAEEIIQKYYEIVDFDNNFKKPIVTSIKEPEESKEIPFDIQEKLTEWTKFYNEKINKENLTITANNFENILEKLRPGLLKNECVLESIIFRTE